MEELKVTRKGGKLVLKEREWNIYRGKCSKWKDN